MKGKEIKLFLDDYREPKFCVYYMYRTIGAESEIYTHDWKIVRNYDEFTKFVSENAGNISHVSFDHDLADTHYNILQSEWESYSGTEKTGYDCAMWFKNLYKELNLPLPIIYVHSMNPAGGERINSLYKYL